MKALRCAGSWPKHPARPRAKVKSAARTAMRRGDFRHIVQAGGVFDHGDDLRMADGQAGDVLQLGQDLRRCAHGRSIRHFWQRNRMDRRAHACLEVAHEQPPGAIHAHQHVVTGPRETVGDRSNPLPRHFFLLRCDAVFEVDLQRVSGLAHGAVDEAIAGRGNEQHRAPYIRAGKGCHIL